MVKKSVVLFVCLVLVFCAETEALEWYEGGTLHKATAREWNRASYRDRLATTADWFMGITKETNPTLQKKLKAIKDFNAWLATSKIFAMELEGCVTDMAANERIISPDSLIPETASLCYITMYLTSETPSKKTTTKPPTESRKSTTTTSTPKPTKEKDTSDEVYKEAKEEDLGSHLDQ